MSNAKSLVDEAHPSFGSLVYAPRVAHDHPLNVALGYTKFSCADNNGGKQPVFPLNEKDVLRDILHY